MLIIIGGTGLYFSSLLNGLAEIPAIPSEVRAKGDAMRLGGASAFEMLADLDPVTWGRIDRQNPARLQRAWEVLEATGRTLSDWQDTGTRPLFGLGETVPVCLDVEKDWLNARIARRFDLMLNEGALEECEAWMARDLPMTLPAASRNGLN